MNATPAKKPARSSTGASGPGRAMGGGLHGGGMQRRSALLVSALSAVVVAICASAGLSAAGVLQMGSLAGQQVASAPMAEVDQVPAVADRGFDATREGGFTDAPSTPSTPVQSMSDSGRVGQSSSPSAIALGAPQARTSSQPNVPATYTPPTPQMSPTTQPVPTQPAPTQPSPAPSPPTTQPTPPAPTPHYEDDDDHGRGEWDHEDREDREDHEEGDDD